MFGFTEILGVSRLPRDGSEDFVSCCANMSTNAILVVRDVLANLVLVVLNAAVQGLRQIKRYTSTDGTTRFRSGGRGRDLGQPMPACHTLNRRLAACNS